MKYKYIPNCYVIDYDNMKTMFVFDENGEFETNDPKLIEWIRKNKNFLKPVQEEKKEQAKQAEPQKEEREAKIYKCKRCDYETDNKGELLAHYREHKKDDE